MRTKLIISLGMLTALAVGCSKSFPTVDENAWIYDESLPVPIQFGSLSSGMVTKAAVTDLDNLAGKPIVVFAWGEGSEDSMETSAKSIFPQKGYMRTEVSGSEQYGYKLEFKEAGAAPKPVYYPMSSKYNYSFYAYSIGSINNETIGADSFSVNVGFSNPFTDILWGKCSDFDVPYVNTQNQNIPDADRILPRLEYNNNVIKGFNSRFSRAAARQEAEETREAVEIIHNKELYYPSIEFQHVCNAISICAKADNSDGLMTDEKVSELNEHLKIKSVEITNVPTSAKLVVASRDGNEGVLDTSDAQTGSVSMSVATDYNISKEVSLLKKSGSTSNDDGEFFLPPGDYGNSKAILHCTLDNNPFDLPFDLKYDVQNADVPTESTVFEAGKKYSFVVLFKTLEKIEIMLSLKDWGDPIITEKDIDNNE